MDLKNKKPMVSYCVNTLNRRYLLENLLNSFHECNTYDGPYEWVITDYGSKDDTRQFLLDYASSNKGINLYFGDGEGYINLLDGMGLSPTSERKKSHAMFGLSRNIAKGSARGDILIEISDDQQFIRKGNWVQDALDIFDHRKSIAGHDDISSIVYRGPTIGKLLKPNNAIEPVSITDSGVEYFIAKHKCYDDYHIQTRETFDTIGPYLEVHKLKDQNLIDGWKNGDITVNHYEEYLKKAQQLNMKKVFMKYPYVAAFPKYIHDKINVKTTENLLVNPVSLQKMKKLYRDLDRAISTEEILHAAYDPQ